MFYCLLPHLWNLQLWKHTAVSTAKGTAAGRVSLSDAAVTILVTLVPINPQTQDQIFFFKAKYASHNMNMSTTHQHRGHLCETISWIWTQSALEKSQTQNSIQYMWHLKGLCNILLCFPGFQGPSLVDLTHFQSQNCDRHISAWKQAQEIRMIEQFKLGQDETTAGNVKSSFDFSAWNELTSNFLFTEWCYIN